MSQQRLSETRTSDEFSGKDFEMKLETRLRIVVLSTTS